jgi:hypothetical protein
MAARQEAWLIALAPKPSNFCRWCEFSTEKRQGCRTGVRLKINDLCREAMELYVAKKWGARETVRHRPMHPSYPKPSKSIATAMLRPKSGGREMKPEGIPDRVG